jgi:membrane peptidoglycan carboxypeptidase
VPDDHGSGAPSVAWTVPHFWSFSIVRIDYPRYGRSGWTRFVPSWRQVLAAAAAAFGLVFLTFGVAYARTSVPDANADVSKAATIVYYDNGTRELGRFAEFNRVPVRLAAVPDHARKAVLAAEDRSFYENRGISPKGFARAVVNNVRGGSRQGGSTITQQFVKNTYLTPETTIKRKAKEFFIALKVDSELTKDQVLENYLNTIYWGRGAYGIEAASQAYFGKRASALTPSEGAYLAGIIQSPSRYELEKNRDGAQRRWAYVLDGMVSEGWLSAAERAQAVFPTVKPKSTRQRLGGPTGYLLDEVREELRRRGFDDDEIEAGGLRVRTTFNYDAQVAAVEAVAKNFPAQNNKRVHVGLTAVRPGDGAGRRDVRRPRLRHPGRNDATDATMPIGSTYKPFTLVAALQKERSLRSRYQGNSPLRLEGDKPVRNEFNEDYGDRIDLYTALEKSVNTAFVDLTRDIGPAHVMRTGQAAGPRQGGSRSQPRRPG